MSKSKKKARVDPAELERLRKALDAATKAAASDASEPKKKKRKKRGRKLVLLALIGALVLSEDLRGKVLDALFGAEEEFQYTPPAPAPPSPVSAA
jgi:ferric-dicitrate binding protein FerR (iron transport regulator)